MQAPNTYTSSAATIETNGTNGVYITNTSIMGAAYGISILNSSYFTIKNISSTTFDSFLYIGNSRYGLIENTLHNSTVLSLNGYYNFSDGYFSNLLRKTLNDLKYIHIANSSNIEALNNFAYAPNTLFTISNSTGYFINNGNDSYPGLANSQNHVVFDICNSTNSNVQIINTHYFIGNSGNLLNNYSSSNKINVANSMKLSLALQNDDLKYENDIISTRISVTPENTIKQYNTFEIKANTNLIFNDGNQLISVLNSTGDIYYSLTQILNSSNYEQVGIKSSLPINNIGKTGEVVVYYYAPEDSVHYERSGGVVVNIEKTVAILPTITDYSGDYDGNAHSISVSGGSGGTIHYSLDNINWSTTKPTRTDAGTTTVYVKVVGDENHIDSETEEHNITINKVSATCPTITDYSGNYDGQAHSITVTGGNGGTIQYSADQTNWSTTKPTRMNVGTTIVYVKVVGDANHNDKICGSKIIQITSAPSIEEPKVLNYPVENQMIFGIKNSTDVSNANIEFNTPYTYKIFNNARQNKTSGFVSTGDIVEAYLENVKKKEFRIVIKGDVNGDGMINSADLLKIRQHLLKTITLDNPYSSAADTTSDSTINSADLLRVRQHLLNIKTIEG